MSSATSARVSRGLMTALAVALLLTFWGADRAEASHDPNVVHVCAGQNGILRLATECRSPETPLVLSTDAAQQGSEARIAALEAEVEAQAAAMDALAGKVEALQELLTGVTRTTMDGHDTLRFSGMNLHVVNGGGSSANGLGNLIIGRNNQRHPSTNIPPAERTGSHYLVVGDAHAWTGHGGILGGFHNTVTAAWTASVLGGAYNTVDGQIATIVGGRENTASGNGAAVLGGAGNAAIGQQASVFGGTMNVADGTFSSVIGGYKNTAAHNWATVLGGTQNVADGAFAVVAGGSKNSASHLAATVLGGSEKSAPDDYECHPACS